MKYDPPTPRPCASCPYRCDVPAGIWAREEYEKLPGYDEPTPFQPHGVFLCHQHDPGADGHPVCGGWAGCHNGDELLALRVAVLDYEDRALSWEIDPVALTARERA